MGPVLICPSDESFVYLSRRGKKITIGEIDLLAVVTADAGGGDQVSQLQLHLKSGERFHLVTAFSKKELRPMAGKIQSCLKMPVVFLKQKSRHELVEEVQN